MENKNKEMMDFDLDQDEYANHDMEAGYNPPAKTLIFDDDDDDFLRMVEEGIQEEQTASTTSHDRVVKKKRIIQGSKQLQPLLDDHRKRKHYQRSQLSTKKELTYRQTGRNRAQREKCLTLYRYQERLSKQPYCNGLKQRMPIFNFIPGPDDTVFLTILIIDAERPQYVSVEMAQDTPMHYLFDLITKKMKGVLYLFTVDGPAPFGGTIVNPDDTIRSLGLRTIHDTFALYAEAIRFSDAIMTKKDMGTICYESFQDYCKDANSFFLKKRPNLFYIQYPKERTSIAPYIQFISFHSFPPSATCPSSSSSVGDISSSLQSTDDCNATMKLFLNQQRKRHIS